MLGRAMTLQRSVIRQFPLSQILLKAAGARCNVCGSGYQKAPSAADLHRDIEHVLVRGVAQNRYLDDIVDRVVDMLFVQPFKGTYELTTLALTLGRARLNRDRVHRQGNGFASRARCPLPTATIANSG